MDDTLTLAELSQILNDLVDVGHGDKPVVAGTALVQRDQVTIELYYGFMETVCIGGREP